MLLLIMIRILSCASALVLLSSCGRNDAPHAAGGPGETLDRFFTPEAHADAGQIHIVRQSAGPGDEVTLQGLVMGRLKPFVDERAAWVLGDPTVLTPCNQKDGDECATPWDVCCDSKEDKRRGTATIQLVGEDGRVISQSLKGVHGLVELSSLTVKGTVAEGSSEESLIVNATEIHVRP
jgi:hypothetical protein